MLQFEQRLARPTTAPLFFILFRFHELAVLCRPGVSDSKTADQIRQFHREMLRTFSRFCCQTGTDRWRVGTVSITHSLRRLGRDFTTGTLTASETG